MKLPGPQTQETISGLGEQERMMQWFADYFNDYIPAARCVQCVRGAVCTANACPCRCHGGPGFPATLPQSFHDDLTRLYTRDARGNLPSPPQPAMEDVK